MAAVGVKLVVIRVILRAQQMMVDGNQIGHIDRAIMIDIARVIRRPAPIGVRLNRLIAVKANATTFLFVFILYYPFLVYLRKSLSLILSLYIIYIDNARLTIDKR